MSGPPDFRLEHSELRGGDEFGEFTAEELPYYSDWHGSFEKLPWAVKEATLRAAGADVAIVGASFDEGVSSRPGARFGPRAIRMAPTAWSHRDAWSIQTGTEPYAHLSVDAGDAPVVPARFERALRVISGTCSVTWARGGHARAVRGPGGLRGQGHCPADGRRQAWKLRCREPGPA
jgi:Arginase family